MKVSNLEIKDQSALRNFLEWEAFFPEQRCTNADMRGKAEVVLEWFMNALKEFDKSKDEDQQGIYWLYPNGVKVLNARQRGISGSSWNTERIHVISCDSSGGKLYISRKTPAADPYALSYKLFARESHKYLIYFSINQKHYEVGSFEWS
jgi:hypothetical protein